MKRLFGIFVGLGAAATILISCNEENPQDVVVVFEEEAGLTAWQQANLRNKEKHDIASEHLNNKKSIFERLIIENSKKYTKT